MPDRPAPPPAPEHSQPTPGRRIARIHPWRIGLIAAIVIVIVFLIGYIPRYKREQQARAAAQREAQRIPVVLTAPVQRSPTFTTLLLPGNITPVTEAYIYARATGYVRHRYADIGDRVTEGQLLADIEAPDLDAQVLQARAMLAQAEKQLDQARATLDNSIAQEDLARVTWDRYRVLVSDGAVSRQDADTEIASYRVAQANVRLEQAAVHTAEENVSANRANLDHLLALQDFEKVRAPFAGIITARNFDVGAFINASGSTSGESSTPNGGTQTVGQLGVGGASGTPPSQPVSPTSPTDTGAPSAASGSQLFREARISRLRILINVPQDCAPSVAPGQSASVYVQEYVNRPFPGRLTRTSSSLDQTVRTLLAEVDLANPQGLLLPGMYAQVELVAQRPSPPLLVPGDGVIAEANGLQAAVLETLTTQDLAHLQQQNTPESQTRQARRIHIQTVQVGRDYGTAVEITYGLREGQSIVVNPGDMVREGAIVIPQAAPPIVGEGIADRQGQNALHPAGIGSPSMAAPTGGEPKGETKKGGR
jgi:multidrug efflux pump subunit AcrA (membrane-fusion protein)